MCATGRYAKVNHKMLNRIIAENLKRSAKPPEISATVISRTNAVEVSIQATSPLLQSNPLSPHFGAAAGAAAGAAGAVAAGVASAPAAGGLSCANAELAAATNAAIDPSSANRASKFFMSFLP